MKNIVYLGPDYVVESLETRAGDTARILAPAIEPDAVAEALKDAHAVLDASMKTKLTDSMLAAAPHLEIISCATTGSDHIGRTELDARDIPVRTLKEDRELLMGLTPAAELSWALLMACARKIPSALEHVRSGGWERELFPGVMVKGKRLGLIGMGRIGGWMARYAEAFGAEVVAYDPFVETFPDNVERVSLEELFAESDFISIHVHLTEETKGMVSRELLETVKPGAIFINTSRGGLCDEAALLDVLESGRLGAAGVDVLADEPEIGKSGLQQYAKKHDNMIITPHCGGYSPDAVRLVCRRAMEKIMNAFRESAE